MNDIERKIYLAIESRIRSFDDEQYLRNIELITKLRRGRITRLRQCASYAKMLQSAIEGYEEDLVDRDSEVMTWITTYDTLEKPAKLEFLSTLVQSFAVKKEKIVIWANFIGTIELISITLAESGYQNEKLYGKTPTEYTALKEEETRESIVRRFLDPESRLDTLIANPAACAESISLHKACQHAIYYDLSYNCAQYLQSLDRIHRVGASETKEAYYHFLQYDNTIDVDIKDSLERKANRMYQIIDEDCTIYSLDMFEDDIEDEKAYERLFTEKQ
ncbi:MAG: DEAD/DEAH box helicase [Ignavibacteriales bacterium]|nr:DEAD/DEAH box helicase [Ignavibacteriales bacterium]